jgi:Zn-dependent protease with chaperone function
MSVLEVICPRCRRKNPMGRLFCATCRIRFEPQSNTSLQLDEFQCSADREALQILESTGILAYLVNQFIVKPMEQKQRYWLSEHGQSLSYSNSVETLVEDCAYRLALETLPEVYAVEFDGSPNAFTFGNDSAPVIVIDRRLIKTMTQDELRALLGHEMGHVKSRHLLFHSLANTLAQGVGISASLMGIGIVTTATRLALTAWQRESEFTADRAALISSGNPNHVASMFAVLLHIRHMPMPDSSSLLEDLSRLFQSHPNHASRIKAVLEFSKSQKYKTIRSNVDHRWKLRKALVSSCRFCSSPKPIDALFCSECGKSQT